MQVHPKPLSSQTCKFHPNFIPIPLSSQNHFHPKPLSSKTTFIQNHIFIQNHFHPMTTFIQNHFHPMCLGERGGLAGGVFRVGVLWVGVVRGLGVCGGAPKGGARRRGGPKFRAFFSLSRHIFFLSSLFLVFSWNFGGVFEAQGP